MLAGMFVGGVYHTWYPVPIRYPVIPNEAGYGLWIMDYGYRYSVRVPGIHTRYPVPGTVLRKCFDCRRQLLINPAVTDSGYGFYLWNP